MPIEDTKRIAQVHAGNGPEEANDYLRLGWTLLCVWKPKHDGAEDGDYANERVYYILGWQIPNREPEYPPYSFSKQRSDDWDSQTGRSRHFTPA